MPQNKGQKEISRIQSPASAVAFFYRHLGGDGETCAMWRAGCTGGLCYFRPEMV